MRRGEGAPPPARPTTSFTISNLVRANIRARRRQQKNQSAYRNSNTRLYIPGRKIGCLIPKTSVSNVAWRRERLSNLYFHRIS